MTEGWVPDIKDWSALEDELGREKMDFILSSVRSCYNCILDAIDANEKKLYGILSLQIPLVVPIIGGIWFLTNLRIAYSFEIQIFFCLCLFLSVDSIIIILLGIIPMRFLPRGNTPKNLLKECIINKNVSMARVLYGRVKNYQKRIDIALKKNEHLSHSLKYSIIVLVLIPVSLSLLMGGVLGINLLF